MAIEGISGPSAPRRATRPRPPPAGGFAVPGSAAAATTGAAPATGPAALSSMLTLQELGSEAVADREARRHGQDLLMALAELQRSLLTATDDTIALQHLARLSGTVPLAADRRLAAMLSAIVVRARVELARRQL